VGKKIVLDTNVIVSAFGWRGAPHKIFKQCISGQLTFFFSPPLLSEIKLVLAYPKFNFNQDEIDEFLKLL